MGKQRINKSELSLDELLSGKYAEKDFGIGRINVPGGLDKHTENIRPDQINYIDDLRGENQSWTEQAINGTVKAVGKTGIRIAQGVFQLPYLLGAGKLIEGENYKGYWESLWNNTLSQGSDEAIQSLNELLPNYYTQEGVDSPITNPDVSNFLFDKLLDGVSFLVAARATGGFASRITNAARSGLSNLNKIKTLTKSQNLLSNTVKRAKDLEKLTGVAAGDLFQKIGVSTYASVVESSIEAYDSYKTAREKLISDAISEKRENGDFSDLTEEEYENIENKSSSVGNWNFLANMLVTSGTNYSQLNQYFGTKSFKNNAVKRSLLDIDDAGKWSTKELTGVQKFFNRPIVKGGLEAGGEGLQESVQGLSNSVLVDYYTADDESQDLFKSLTKGMHETFGTQEGLEQFIMGALIGGGAFLATGQHKQNAKTQKALNEAVSILNILPETQKEFIKESVNNYNRSVSLTKNGEESLERGDKFSYLGVQALNLHNIVSKHVDFGTFDDYIDSLEKAKNLSDDDFMDQFNVDSVENKDGIIDEMIDKSKRLKTSYEKIKINYGDRLSNEEIGRVATVASISDDAVNRQGEIITKLKEEFGYDLVGEIFSKSTGLDSNIQFETIDQLTKDLNTKRTQASTLANQRKKDKNNQKFIDDLNKINNEIVALGNDLEAITNLTNEVNEVTYQEVISNLTAKAKNVLDEKTRRRRVNGILNPTNRKEFEDLLKDFDKLEVTKNEFVDTYNKLTNPNTYQKAHKELSDKINKVKQNKLINQYFTIDTVEQVDIVDKDGKKQTVPQKSKILLERGIYTGDFKQDSYVEDGETTKINTPNNFYEILDRRITNEERLDKEGNVISNPLGVPRTEVLVSINGEPAKWIETGKLNTKKLQRVNNGGLDTISPEHVFYSKYKNRLITIEYDDFYTWDELQEELKKNKNRKNPQFGGKFIPGGDTKISKSGFLGLDKEGNVTFRVFNEQTKKFEALNGYYLKPVNSDGTQDYTKFNFKVDQNKAFGTNDNGKGFYFPHVKYTDIRSEEFSDKWFMGKFADKHIDTINTRIEELISQDETSKTALLNKQKELKKAKQKLANVQKQISETPITSLGVLKSLNYLTKQIQRQIDTLEEELNYKETSLEILEEDLFQLQSTLEEVERRNLPSSEILIQEIEGLEMSFKFNASEVLKRVYDNNQQSIEQLEQLKEIKSKVEAELVDQLTQLVSPEQVVEYLEMVGQDVEEMTETDINNFILNEYDSMIDYFEVNDSISDELIDNAYKQQEIIEELEKIENDLDSQIEDSLFQKEFLGTPFTTAEGVKIYAGKGQFKNPNVKETAEIRKLQNTVNQQLDETGSSSTNIYSKNLEIAALRSQLKAFEKLKEYATYDQRLKWDKNIDYINSWSYSTKNPNKNIETPSNDVDGGIEGLTKSITTNGTRPFMTTTGNSNDFPKGIKNTDSDNLKSQFTFNNVVTLVDPNDYKIELRLTTPFDNEKSAKAEGSIYAIVVNKYGEEVKFDLTGKPNERGLIAHAVLPDTTWETSGGYKRFHDQNPSNEEHGKLLDSYIKERNEILEQLKNGQKVFYSINDKSLGIRVYSKESNSLKKIVNYNLTDKNQYLTIATSKSMKIGNQEFPTVAGKAYYINENTKQVIPLNSRKLNDQDINNIVNGILYYADPNNSYSLSDLNNYHLSNYLNVGKAAENSDISYEFYFNPATNNNTIIFNEVLESDKGVKYVVKKEISLNDLSDANNVKTKAFKEFLSRRTYQINRGKIIEAEETKDKGKSLPTLEFRQFDTPASYKKSSHTYYYDLLEKQNAPLTSDMIPNSNSTDSIVKPQWVGGYFTLGDQVKPDVRKTEETSKTGSKAESFSNIQVTPIPLGEGYSIIPTENSLNVYYNGQDLGKIEGSTQTEVEKNIINIIKTHNPELGSGIEQELKKLFKKEPEAKSVSVNEQKGDVNKLQALKKLSGKGSKININVTEENETSETPSSETASAFGEGGMTEQVEPIKSTSKKLSFKTGDSIADDKNFPFLLKNPSISLQPKMTKASLIEATKRLKDRYGIAVEKITGLIEGKAYGQFINAAEKLVKLSDQAVIGTDYHEEFHIVENLYLTPEQKQKVYESYRNLNNGKLTDQQVSEGLAEAYRYHALTNDVKTKYKATYIEKFIKALSKFIDTIFRFNNDSQDSKDIKDLFDNIYEGNYTNNITVGDKFKINEKIQLFKSFNHYFFKFINTSPDRGGWGSNVFAYIANKSERDLVDQRLIDSYSEYYGTKDVKYIIIQEILERMFEETGNQNEVLFDKIVSNLNELQSEYFEYLDRNFNFEYEDIIENDENSIQRDPLHLKNSAETDHAGKPSQIVKTLLSTLPGNPNGLGLIQTVELDEMVKQLHNDLQGVETWEDISSLLVAKSANSDYGQYYQELKNQLDYVNRLVTTDNRLTFSERVAMINLKNTFLSNFSKMKLDYINTQLEYDRATETYAVKNINQTKEANRKKIKSTFETDVNIAWQKRTGLWNNWWKNGKEDVSNFKSQLKERSDAVGYDMYKAFQLLKDLGIEFSDPNLYNPNTANKTAAEYLSSKDIENLFNKKYGIFTLLYDNAEVGKYNLFGKLYKIDSKISKLTDLESSIVGENLNNSVITEGGKRLYPYSDENSIVRKLKDHNKKLEEDGSSQRLKLVSIVESSKVIKNDGVVEQGLNNAVSDLSDIDLFLSDLFVISNGIYPFIFSGSKSMYYGIEGFYYETKNALGSYDYSNEYLSMFQKEIDFYVKNKFVKGDNDNPFGISQRDTGGTNLNILKEILNNNKLFDQIVLKVEEQKADFNLENYLNKSKNRNVFDNSIKQHIAEKTQQYIDFLTDNNLIEVNNKKNTVRVKSLPDNLLNKYKTANNVSKFESNKWYSRNDFDHLIKNVFTDFVANGELNKYEQLEIITDNLAYYKDPLKRFMGYMGTRNNVNVGKEFLNIYNSQLRHPNTTFQGDFTSTIPMMVVNDITTNNKELGDYFKSLNDLVSARTYDNGNDENGAINVTDAQGYEHIDFYRFRRIAEGTWNNEELERVYDKIVKGDSLTGDEAYLMIGKTQGVSQFKHNGENVPVFIKTSVIIPSLVKDAELKKMSDWMGQKGVGLMMNESAVKFGRVIDTETRSGISAFDKDGKFTGLEGGELFLQNVDLRYYGTQVKMNDVPKDKISTATQERSLIFSNLVGIRENSENKEWVDNTINELNSLEIAKAELALESFKERLGLREVEGGYEFENYEKLAEELIKETEMRELPISFKNDITFMLDKYQTLDLIPRESKIESILLSLVTSNVIKSKRKGDAKAMVSSAGYHSFDTVKDIDDKYNLKFYPVDESGSNFAMEVFLPSYLSDRVNLGDSISINQDSDTNPLLKIIGFRIPTQGLNSIEVIKVKGFLPASMGNAVIVPKEITAKAGSDFDIDKLNLYFPNSYKKDGKSVYIKGYVNDQELYKQYEEYLGVTDIERNESYAERLEMLAQHQNQRSFKSFKVQAIENRILEKHIEILQHPDNRQDMLTPNTDYNIKGIAKGQGNEEYPIDQSVRSLKGNDKPFRKSDMLDHLYLIKQKKAFETGKNTLAQFALHMVNHVKSQVAGLSINSKLFTSPNFEGSYTGRLDNVYDNKGRLITKNIEQFQNAAVDAEKDEYLSDLNINTDTVPVIMYLIRLGVPLEEASYFLSQPVITEWINTVNRIAADPTVSQNRGLVIRQANNIITNNYKDADNYSGTFELEVLKKNLQNPQNDFQKKVFEEFQNYMKQGKLLNKLIQITTFDTKASSTSYAGNQIRERQYDRFIKEDNVVKVKNKANEVTNRLNTFITNHQTIDNPIAGFYETSSGLTYTGYFRNVVFEANKYYKNLYRSDEFLNDPAVEELINNIIDDYSTEEEKVKNLNNLKREMLTYVVQNHISRDNETINQRKNTLMTGDRSIANFVQIIKNNPSDSLNENYLIQNLIPIIHPGEAHLIFLEDANDVSVERANNFTEAYYEIYNKYPNFAKGLVTQSILQSGFMNSPTTLHNIIPVEVLADVVGDYYADVRPDFSNFKEVYLYQNRKNSSIVPYVHRDFETETSYIPKGRKWAREGDIVRMKKGKDEIIISKKKDDKFDKIKDYGMFSINEKYVSPEQNVDFTIDDVKLIQKQLNIENCG